MSIMTNKVFKKNITIENTKSFKYFYTVGYYVNADIVYELYLKDNKYIASYKMDGVPNEEKIEKEVEIDTVLKIEDILKQYKVSKWNGFNKNDPNVLDGNSFHLSYVNEKDETIEASGYMMYPKDYRLFRSDIDTLYENLFKDEIEKQKTTQE